MTDSRHLGSPKVQGVRQQAVVLRSHDIVGYNGV